MDEVKQTSWLFHGPSGTCNWEISGAAFGFENKTGVLLETSHPEYRSRVEFRYSCHCGVYRQFGDFWFPREVSCFEDTQPDLDVTIVELSAEPSPDAALFKPPAGAFERLDCTGSQWPPIPQFRPDPSFPQGRAERNASVVISLVVDQHGGPQELTVARSGGKNFDKEALDAVRRWRFKPAT